MARLGLKADQRIFKIILKDSYSLSILDNDLIDTELVTGYAVEPNNT